MTDKEAKETLKTMKENIDKKYLKTRNSLAIETVLNLIQTQQAKIEKKDDKLKDIKNHIKAELKIIDKLYNEVGWAGKEQYDGMKAAYKCLLNIYFENEVETEEK